MLFLFFQARGNCHGDKNLEEGKCSDFKCINDTSCNYHGHCTSDGKACDCAVGFDGIDCSIDLTGEQSYSDIPD